MTDEKANRTRRRGEVLEEAISRAVQAELAEHGYTGVTFDRVAARAGTSKPVLYRRWSTRAEMVLASATSSRTARLAVPDLGNVRAELIALLQSVRANFGTTDRTVLLGLLAELDDENRESAPRVVFAWGADVVEPLVKRAAGRGELGDTPPPRSVLALPFDLARHQLLMSGDMSDDFIRFTVDEVVVPLFRIHCAGLAKPPSLRNSW